MYNTCIANYKIITYGWVKGLMVHSVHTKIYLKNETQLPTLFVAMRKFLSQSANIFFHCVREM